MPFDEVGDVFLAFAHAYPQGNGAVLKYEANNEPPRLKRLEQVGRAKNPRIKVFNWNMSADSKCDDFKYTRQIANDVGY